MDIKQYSLDAEKSKKIYEDNSNNIRIKECYKNIFDIVTEYMLNFDRKKWRIAYGYTSAVGNILCRHCFILDENDTVIDPTMFAIDRDDIENKTFYAIYVFEDVIEYLRALNLEGGYPVLYKYLKVYDKAAQEWAKKNSFVLIE